MMLKPVAAAALVAALALPAAAETIRVGMSGGYFPFTFVQQDELQGFEVDFMNAVAERTGDTVEFSTMSFSGLIGALEAGRIDTVANQITITPEREAKFVFSQPYVYDGAQIVVKEGNPAGITGPESLKGKSVAVNLGSNFEQLLRELPYADEIDIRTYESNIEQDTALGPRRRLRDGPGVDGAGDREVAAAARARRRAVLADRERAAVPRRRGGAGAARQGRRGDHRDEGGRDARRRSRRSGSGRT